MTRVEFRPRVLAEHPATEVNPPWSVAVSTPTPDCTVAVVRVDADFDLAEPDDRKQATDVAHALCAALRETAAEAKHRVRLAAKDQTRNATPAEVADLLSDYARLLTDRSNRSRPAPHQIGEHLGAFADTLHDALDGDDGRAPLTEWRRDSGMCPDTGEHWWADCPAYECETWWNENADVRPLRAAELGLHA